MKYDAISLIPNYAKLLIRNYKKDCCTTINSEKKCACKY